MVVAVAQAPHLLVDWGVLDRAVRLVGARYEKDLGVVILDRDAANHDVLLLDDAIGQFVGSVASDALVTEERVVFDLYS